jgi:phenylalanyl-tRNA synthetase beta chain
MLISYNWLKKYLDLNLAPMELCGIFNNSGLPVEEVNDMKAPFTGVVVGKVLTVEKHLQADNLHLCDVTDGTETLKIVCGAANVTAGITVALARIGAVLPGNFKIKRAKIRGIESNGMLCSESELGLAKESSGIMILDENDHKPGDIFEPYKPDTIFNLEVTPNRPDLLCVTGVARFLSSHLGLKLKYPSCDIALEHIDPNLDINSKIKIDNRDVTRCPRYTARLIEGVKIADSPQWLKDALTNSGIRPINNVVDVTNYILLEMNQPLHAFDLKKLKGGQIVIRTAVQGEKILALDAKEYFPRSEDLVIADEKDPAALAGVMGGEYYSVDPATSSVVLESACFLSKSVRKTSRRLGVSSDSSYRFERGTDIDNCVNAINRAAELIAEVSGGKISKNIIDIYPQKAVVNTISLRYSRINKLLDTAFTPVEVKGIIDKLSFPYRESGPDSINVDVPFYRVDILEEIDLIEDVAQIYGYNNIKSSLPFSGMSITREPEISSFKKSLSGIMTSCGFSEALNYSFMNNKLLKALKAENYQAGEAVPLKNPFNDEETHMKTILLPDLIKNLITNVNNENENVHLFEISNIFLKHAGEYIQIPKIAAVTYGSIIEKAFNRKEFTTDFYYLKSVMNRISASLNCDKSFTYKTAPAGNEFYEYYTDICASDKIIGNAGQLKEEIAYDYKFKQKAFMFELDINSLFELLNKNVKYAQISRFPSVKRDISIVVDDSVAQDKVESIIRSDYRAMIKALTLFDLYKGNQVPAGCKSLSYNIIFQSGKKTLSESEINKAMERIVSRLKSEVKAELRS